MRTERCLRIRPYWCYEIVNLFLIIFEMVCCALRACSSRNVVESKKQSGITYHRFPKDSERRKVWLHFVNRLDWEPSKYSVLCSKHFEEKYIDRTSLCCVRLRENAIPTISSLTEDDNNTVAPEGSSFIQITETERVDKQEIIINVLENQFVCNICVQGAQKLVSICETPQDNIKWIAKLNTCIPEVNWNESFMICEVCSQRLNEVFNFRNLCIGSNISNLCTHREFDLNNTGCTLCKGTSSIPEEYFISPEEPLPVKTKKNRIPDIHCENCKMVFSSGAKLVSHCVAVHGYNASDVRPFQCDVCLKKFTKSSYLTNHKQYHDRVRQFICTFCGKGFITSNDLVCHEKRHLNKTQHSCDRCSKSFNSEQNLRKHTLIVHTNPTEWKYVCPYCEKRCATRSSHIQHIRAHSRRKRFACHLCDKRFGVKIALQKHVATHWNIKPFKCQHCNMKYKSESAFHVHLKRVHNIGDAKVRKK